MIPGFSWNGFSNGRERLPGQSRRLLYHARRIPKSAQYKDNCNFPEWNEFRNRRGRQWHSILPETRQLPNHRHARTRTSSHVCRRVA